tara:strand:- start:150 stop:719 length:570 start_codon:yes stop_codon:yes gene_type:complete
LLDPHIYQNLVVILLLHSHLDPRLLLVVVEVVVDQQTEDHLIFTTRHNLVDQVVVEVDIVQITHILHQMATYIHQLLLFILPLHLDKEIQVDHPPEEVLILEQVVVDRVQLENPTAVHSVVMEDREHNFLPHSEIQLLMLVILDLVAPDTTSRVVVEEDPPVLVERVVHGMDLHYFLVDHILVQETVII